MVAIGSEVAVLSAGAFNLINGTAMNVLDFGAKNTGLTADATTNDAAILAAFNALPANGGVLVFPSGLGYYVTGISFSGKPVLILGDWGRGQDYSSGDFSRAPTRIRSATNAPIVTFTDTAKSSIEGQHSCIMNIAILGSGAGANQHGLVIDNRGTNVQNVEVAQCGGDGIRLIDCISSSFSSVASHRNLGKGWYLDPTLGTGIGPPAVTNTVFLNCASTFNGGNGIHYRGQIWGTVWIGGDTEGNTGYGLFLEDDGSVGPRFNRWYGIWDESNTGGSVRFDDVNTTDNIVEYSRYSSGNAFHASGGDRNAVNGSNISLVGNAQRPVNQIGAILNSPITSADFDNTRFRNRDDSDNGNAVAFSFVSTFGLPLAAGSLVNSLAIPQATDAFCLPHTRGISWRNNANNANIQGIAVGSVVNDVVTLDATQGAMVAKAAGKVGFFGTTPVVRSTGWVAATGTATRSTFLTSTVTLSVLAEHVKALEDDLLALGLIGA